jgi:hypothetical protein
VPLHHRRARRGLRGTHYYNKSSLREIYRGLFCISYESPRARTYSLFTSFCRSQLGRPNKFAILLHVYILIQIKYTAYIYTHDDAHVYFRYVHMICIMYTAGATVSDCNSTSTHPEGNHTIVPLYTYIHRRMN